MPRLTVISTAAKPAALLEYEAQDRRLHELLELVRTASYDHVAKAVQQPGNWRFANDLAAANESLERALREVRGAS